MSVTSTLEKESCYSVAYENDEVDNCNSQKEVGNGSKDGSNPIIYSGAAAVVIGSVGAFHVFVSFIIIVIILWLENTYIHNFVLS